MAKVSHKERSMALYESILQLKTLTNAAPFSTTCALWVSCGPWNSGTTWPFFWTRDWSTLIS